MNNNTIANQNNLHEPDEQGINYRRIINRYMANWHYFVLSLLLCMCLGFVYKEFTTPIYRISAKLLVNDDKKGGGVSSGSGSLVDFNGLLGSKGTVDNEVEILKTRYLLRKVVKDLQLNTTYFRSSHFGRKEEIYSAPFSVILTNQSDTATLENTKVTISNGRVALKNDEIDTVVSIGSRFNLPGMGPIQIVLNKTMMFAPGAEYYFTISDVRSKVAQLSKNLNVAITNKQVTIIDLGLNSALPRKGEDILNRLIYNYVQENLRDKNEVADSTISFIQRRLMIIGSELGDAENSIEGFKQRNNLADMSEQGRLLVNSSSQYIDELAKIETQISIVTSLIDYLSDESKNKRVLPSSLASPDLVFSSAIEKYNALLLERGRSLIGLSEENPIVVNLDKEIANARSDINANLRSTLQGLNITRKKIEAQMAGAENKIKEVPTTERNYLKLARQQQIKQELFIFLMQKSEETAISKTANIANSRIIDPPLADVLPFSPKVVNVYLLALGMGLFLPVIFLYFKDLLNDKVESKEDIKSLTKVPILGEISHYDDENNLAVYNHSRSAVSEQFRALRTNLSFYLKKKDEKTILLTSSMSGEGKSFVGINLGSILAASGKKVLLMELDLRKPGLSNKLNMPNTFGFTNYLISEDLSIDDIVKPLSVENMFLVSSGPLPPNPAELLMSEKTINLINELKTRFDYIILDAPPVGILTDAEILIPLADICLYLIRQNFTFKHQLNIVDSLEKSQKIPNIGIVINDISLSGTYGHGYGYGYGYGYGNEPVVNSRFKFWPFTK